MQIFVKTLTGKTTPIDVDPQCKVSHVQNEIHKIEGILVDQQRLIYAGMQLESHKTLTQYKVTESSTLHLVLRLRGMISDFGQHHTNLPTLVNLLNSSDPASYARQIPQYIYHEQVQRLGANPNAFFEVRQTHIVSRELAHKLCWFTEAVCDILFTEQSRPVPSDHKFVLSPEVCDVVIGPGFYDDLSHMANASTHERIGRKLVIRRSEGPTNGFLPFHTDGSYATKTIQILLNDDIEYTGGRFCAFHDDEMKIPKRTQGTLSIHDAKVMHGVSKMIQGVKYALFFVNNGNDMGYNVTELTPVCVTEALSRLEFYMNEF